MLSGCLGVAALLRKDMREHAKKKKKEGKHDPALWDCSKKDAAWIRERVKIGKERFLACLPVGSDCPGTSDNLANLVAAFAAGLIWHQAPASTSSRVTYSAMMQPLRKKRKCSEGAEVMYELIKVPYPVLFILCFRDDEEDERCWCHLTEEDHLCTVPWLSMGFCLGAVRLQQQKDSHLHVLLWWLTFRRAVHKNIHGAGAAFSAAFRCNEHQKSSEQIQRNQHRFMSVDKVST